MLFILRYYMRDPGSPKPVFMPDFHTFTQLHYANYLTMFYTHTKIIYKSIQIQRKHTLLLHLTSCFACLAQRAVRL